MPFQKLLKVRYRPVVGRPGYRIGTDGSVWSRWTRRCLKGKGSVSLIDGPWKRLKLVKVEWTKGSGHSYWKISLKNKMLFVHRLMAEAFLGPPPSAKSQVRHLDGNGLNNDLGNLAWGSNKQNAEDRVRHGTQVRVSKHPHASMTEEKVTDIRNKRKAGWTTVRLAEEFKTTTSNVSKICLRQLWTHV